MRSAGRFVVDTHGHITTVYQPANEVEGEWDGLSGEVLPVDNSPLTLYDMDRYGIDMLLLKPSMIGTTNEAQSKLVDKYPDKFRAFCADQTLKLKVARGQAKWTLDAAAEEVEAALKTGKFIGIGEFVPRDTSPDKVYTFKERLDEYRVFCELARTYHVSIDFHDFAWHLGFDTYDLLARISVEFPDVPIIFCHAGYSIGGYTRGSELIRRACEIAGMAVGPGASNVYLECGTWPAEYFHLALKDPNVTATQLLWGADYGLVPQYINMNPGGDPSTYVSAMKRWPRVPTYQPDWWSWMLHQIDKLRDQVGPDEINLILGGNACRVWDLPVPHENMFMSGRPDVWGIRWPASVD
ncbi:MAG: amidohydrolase family protein [Thermoleophilia bacterium]|nr:amidohydrolase family protein [Thermoleophilia bacterium]